MLTTDRIWRELESADGNWRSVVAQALVASLALALVVSVLLFARRVSGALDAPLAPVPLVVTAAGLLVWTYGVRLFLADQVPRYAVDWLPAVVLALVAAACSFPGNRSIDWLVWLTAFAAYGLIPARLSSPAVGTDKRAEQLLQQLTRSRTADGVETIHGTITAEFAPGDRTAVLYVAFCPPFERLPSVEAESEDGSVKVAQVLHQGARLEVRLDRVERESRLVAVEILVTDRPLAL